MGRVSTDRKVYMEPQEGEDEMDYYSTTSSCSSSPARTIKGFTYNTTSGTNSSNNNRSSSNINNSSSTPGAAASTIEGGGSSTIRTGLKKLSSLNSHNLRKALTKLGSQNEYEQILGEHQQQQSSDIATHAAGGIFPTHQHPHKCSSFGGVSQSLRAEGDEVAVRIGDLRGEPSSNGPAVAAAWSPRGALSTSLPIEQLSASPREPLLKEVDNSVDGHCRRRSAATCSQTVAGVNSQPDRSLPPRCPKVESTAACRREGSGGAAGIGIAGQGSYDFRNDLPIPPEEGPAAGGGSNSSSRHRPKSFDFGTVVEDDPPTKLIGAFLRRQTESGSSFLDLDLEMDELTPVPKQQQVLPKSSGSSSSNSILSPVASDHKEQLLHTPSPERNGNAFVRDSSYEDLVVLDHPTVGDPKSPSVAELWKWKEQSLKQPSDPLTFPQAVSDVRINVGVDETYVKGVMGDAARGGGGASPRSTSPESGIAGSESPSSAAGLRLRRNGSSRPSSLSPVRTSAVEEVLKPTAQNVVRPSISRLASRQKSRLVDVPKPPDGTPKASGAIIDESKQKNSRELKSGLVGNKLKKVEEEEEDPLKVTDLPEKYRKREKGFWKVLQLSALLVIVAGLACVLSFPSLRKMKRGGLALWKWVLLVMVVFCGRLIAGWIVWIIVFVIEKNFLLRKRVVYFVYALRKGVQNCLWLGFALLAWHFMIDPKVDNNRTAIKYVTKVLVCFLVGAIIVLVKTFIVKVFASSFHVNNYFERIHEALLNQYIMETLAGPPRDEYLEQDELDEEKRLNEEIAGLRDAGASGPSLSKVPNLPPINTRVAGLPPRPSLNTKSAMMGSGMIGSQQNSGIIGRTPRAEELRKKSGSRAELNSGITIDHLQKLDMSNISAWNMKRLIYIIRNSTLTHSLEETVNSVEGAEEAEIKSEWQAKRKAKQIIRNVAKPGQKVITEEDLLRFMDEELAKKALEQFEGATETKVITRQALKKWAIEAFKERRALAYSLNDTKTAVNKLHRMIDVVVGIIIIVIWLLLLGIATTKLLLFLSSQILLLILVWGNTLRTVFEAIVFLFVMHPFDVGDRCVVDGMQLVVEEMNILTTVFLGDFNVKIWFPNSVLATKPIQNYYRSPEMGDGVEFIVQANTPLVKIDQFREKIGKYILSKPNHWHQDYVLNVLQMTEGERMKLSLGLKHTVNYQNFGEIVKRRSDLLLKVKLFLQEVGIEYHLPPQEVLLRQQTD